MSVNDFLNGQSPIEKFNAWFEEAKKTNLTYANAMVLSTVSPEGFPTSRVVLMKETRPEGLVFYTNYESLKGQHMVKNPKVAANFYWDPLFRQVKWLGTVEKVSREDSEAYWNSRPRESQIGQWVSKQSRAVANRETLDNEYKAAETKWQNQNIPCPQNWGGYLLRPTYVEFWIGREGRFHDRYTYQKVENQWLGQRLYP
jgi:pyridoxamine 5'-phosphate oxidase